MKLSRILLTLALVACALPVQAQTTMTTTTLSANQAADANVMSVTSATGFTVGNFIWVDSEQQQITAITGTAISVRRAQNGTLARAHDNSDRVYTGAANHFQTSDPDYGADCTRGAGTAAYMPWINVRTGNFWVCRAESSTWNGTNAATLTFDSRPAQF